MFTPVADSKFFTISNTEYPFPVPKLYASIKCNENALYYWIMQYSSVMKVISPESLVNKVKEGLKKALDKYQQS